MSKAEGAGEVHDGEGADLFTGAYTVRVAASVPQRVVAATVTPLDLGTDEPGVSAIVSWEGIDAVTSSVSLEVEATAVFPPAPWARFLALLWVVVGPETMPEPSAVGPGRWSSAVLATQELDRALEHSVVVVVDRARVTARLVRSDPTRPGAELAIPVALLEMDAGTVLVEMTSRLVLGRPWL